MKRPAEVLPPKGERAQDEKPMATERELREAFRRLAAGDMAALEQIVRCFGAAMGSYALAILGSADDAEDVVMDVLVGLVRRRRALAGVENPKAYLLAAVRNRARRRMRRRRAGVERARGAMSGPEPAEAAAVRLALWQLPPQQREVVALKVWGGLTFSEIGQLLGIPANTAASRYRYGLDKLRRILGGFGDERV